MDSILAVEQWTSFLSSQGCLRRSWELVHSVHICFVDLEKAYDCVLWGVPWGELQEYGYQSHCHEPCDPYITKVGCVCIQIHF